jgi:hypothetical protein
MSRRPAEPLTCRGAMGIAGGLWRVKTRLRKNRPLQRDDLCRRDLSSKDVSHPPTMPTFTFSMSPKWFKHV